MKTGTIHSFESFGTVDGPGIRFVVFMQGCPFRCLYCHNPDTWNFEGGNEYTVEQVMLKINRYIPYFKNSGGGVTISGGEPLIQIDFLIELLMECKKEGIHTAIDTNGYLSKHALDIENDPKVYIPSPITQLLRYTDLVLLDIKHMNPEAHKELTGFSNKTTLEFARYLDKKKIPVWLRYVVVPGLTDKTEDIMKLGEFINSLSNIEKVELLPFHKMGEYKWQSLGLNYSLVNTPAASENDILRIKSILGI